MSLRAAGPLPVQLFLVIAIATAPSCRQDAVTISLRSTAPQVSGTLVLEDLTRPVTVVRDRWGVPHIAADNEPDLFVAQGFVQAQDRLFQMDLWRRSVQGRLAEVLGANFIERDAMTRRVQYRGNIDAEWASYGPDAKRIAAAFVRGINAWVARASVDLPEEFALAGWKPERWRAEDLLNRTEAFGSGASAQDEVFRARLIASIGRDRADALLPPPNGRTTVQPGVDLSAVSYLVGDTLRRVGTPPFFAGLTGRQPSGSNAWAIAPSLSATGAPLLAGDPHRVFANPSLRYLIHLKAPGWNVAGATAPWLPGVAIGHNERVAWSFAASAVDTQDLFVERVDPTEPHRVEDRGRFVEMDVERDAVHVKGRSEPFDYERLYSSHGVIVGLDRDRHLAYALRWSGTAEGAAPELGALAINRAQTAAEFSRALSYWKMPAADFVFADRDGHIGRQLAALVPTRLGWSGEVPAAGWSGDNRWRGWTAANTLPADRDPASGFVAAANGDSARLARIAETLRAGRQTVGAFKLLQHDVRAWNATRLIPLLERLRGSGEVEQQRQRLLAWDRQVDVASSAASLYVSWETTLMQRLVSRRVPGPLVMESIARAGAIVPLILHPTHTWFDAEPAVSRDALLMEALQAVSTDPLVQRGGSAWGSSHTVVFKHPLGVGELAGRRFDVGPFQTAGYAHTVLANNGAVGPSFRAVFDLSDWDRSVVTQAPGQSESPASPHFADLAELWASGSYFPLVFSEDAVQQHAETTLTLLPR